MKSSKIMTVLIFFLLGVIAAMAYFQSKENKKNPLQEAVEQIQKVE